MPMNDLKGVRAVVAGAGAVGSTLALHLLRCGAQVRLADPGAPGANASGVAAGMLAPVFEALLDPLSEDHLACLRAGRDLWPDFAQSLGLGADQGLDRSGAAYAGAPDELEALVGRARTLRVTLQPLSAAEARACFPLLGPDMAALFTPEDWRLEPRALLAALHEAFRREGGVWDACAVSGVQEGQARMADGRQIAADVVVLASGAHPLAWADVPVLDRLVPVKGQILCFAGVGPARGPVLRARGVYLAPSTGGMLAGATMEPGLSDLRIDPQAVAGLRAAAARLYPVLGSAAASASAGVRAATPDGLPMVGPAGPDGAIMLAAGARRNGWLLAPLMARVLTARLLGQDAGAAGRAFDPARFA
jgi:glycine oxidase